MAAGQRTHVLTDTAQAREWGPEPISLLRALPTLVHGHLSTAQRGLLPRPGMDPHGLRRPVQHRPVPVVLQTLTCLMGRREYGRGGSGERLER